MAAKQLYDVLSPIGLPGGKIIKPGKKGTGIELDLDEEVLAELEASGSIRAVKAPKDDKDDKKSAK